MVIEKIDIKDISNVISHHIPTSIVDLVDNFKDIHHRQIKVISLFQYKESNWR